MRPDVCGTWSAQADRMSQRRRDTETELVDHRTGGVMSASHVTDTASVAIDDWRELAGREGDGLEISLLWSRAADRVKVIVADSRLDESFELHIAGADALAAFHHPFAYAAGRGLGFGDALRETHHLQTQS
jgi:hypothetical protein